ncbi:MAG: DUF6054 family protein [Clostridia bacterium]
MAVLKWEGKGEFEELLRGIIDEVTKSAISAEVIAAERTISGTVKTALLVFEKYYMRNESRASLSVQIVAESGNIKVVSVGSGGGRGVFFNFSWGAEESFAQTIADYLEGKGFVRV